MDNLAHALVGAALGRAVADRHVPSAAVIGAFAANTPDIAEIFTGYLRWSRPEFLLHHRGITHSLLGALVEIAVLTLMFGVGFRRVSIRPQWRWVLALVGVAVLSHVFMDWQGSYGWRPFLPWTSTWYYLDWVAIADPFFWLVPLVALAWGADRQWPALSAAGIGCGVVFFIIWRYVRAGGSVSSWVVPLCVFVVVIGLTGWIQFWFGPILRQRAAIVAVLLLALYSSAQGMVVQHRKHEIRAEAMHRFGPAASWAALTNIGEPFTWEAMYASPDSVVAEDWQAARNLTVPAVARAVRTTPDGRAIAQFARFLTARVDAKDSTVYVWDSRYARGARGGWAAVTIRLR